MMKNRSKIFWLFVFFGCLVIWFISRIDLESTDTASRDNTLSTSGRDSKFGDNSNSKDIVKIRAVNEKNGDTNKELNNLLEMVAPLIHQQYTDYKDIKYREELLQKIMRLDPQKGLNLLSELQAPYSVYAVMKNSMDAIPKDTLSDWLSHLCDSTQYSRTNLDLMKISQVVGLLAEQDESHGYGAVFRSLFTKLKNDDLWVTFFVNAPVYNEQFAFEMANSPELSSEQKKRAKEIIVKSIFDQNNFTRGLELVKGLSEDGKTSVLLEALPRAFSFGEDSDIQNIISSLKANGASQQAMNEALVHSLFLGKSSMVDEIMQSAEAKRAVTEAFNNPLALSAITKLSPEMLGKLLFTADIESKNSSNYAVALCSLIDRGELDWNQFYQSKHKDASFNDAVIEALYLMQKNNVEKADDVLESLPLDLKQHYSVAAIKSLLNSLDSESKTGSGKLLDAWSQVAKIVDPQLKKQAEGQVWGKERDMVRNTVNSAPQKAIEELVSGKSQHDAYWIEEAMDVWMAKDFDNAEKWYQDNWKNLPADKAQYAAASFAKQAIKTGDLDVAEQWLPYIQDPKTKARIQAEVSKAAGE
jgi:hypothetical protein